MAKGNEKQSSLAGYEVLLCATGGIACYKSADLASQLVQAGAGVSVAMTDAAMQFIQPLTFQTLTQRPVYTSLWTQTVDFRSQHISLTELADLMIVAPATANILGKFANGIADDLVSSLALAATGLCPILVAPATNVRMWSAAAVAANVKKLRGWGYHFIGPEKGRLADGTVGLGRMSEPQDILEAARKLLLKKSPRRAD
jgi:phosphopantothenoylcysteine decarboxylase/phosphopantothenate--cysteine ligase